jgi:hypothetical protein
VWSLGRFTLTVRALRSTSDQRQFQERAREPAKAKLFIRDFLLSKVVDASVLTGFLRNLPGCGKVVRLVCVAICRITEIACASEYPLWPLGKHSKSFLNSQALEVHGSRSLQAKLNADQACGKYKHRSTCLSYHQAT